MQLQPLTDLLQKRMNRKEFLRTVSLILLTVVGLGILIKNPGSGTTSGTTPKPAPKTDTYGT